MVFIHIPLHKLTRLLACFDIYYHYLMNYTKLSVNEISKIVQLEVFGELQGPSRGCI